MNPPRDTPTMLLDLLAGWSRFVGEAADDGEETPEEFRAKYGPDDNPPDQATWRQHYTQDYAYHLAGLYQQAAATLKDEDEPTTRLTPRQFLEQHILPLFDEPPQDQP